MSLNITQTNQFAYLKRNNLTKTDNSQISFKKSHHHSTHHSTHHTTHHTTTHHTTHFKLPKLHLKENWHGFKEKLHFPTTGKKTSTNTHHTDYNPFHWDYNPFRHHHHYINHQDVLSNNTTGNGSFVQQNITKALTNNTTQDIANNATHNLTNGLTKLSIRLLDATQLDASNLAHHGMHLVTKLTLVLTHLTK